LYKKGTIRKVIRNGIKLELDLSDSIDHFLYFGLIENSFTHLKKLLKKNDVIFDIGANNGYTSLAFSQEIGENGKIFSFEPDNINYNRAKKNIELNNVKNINLLKFGIGSKTEKLKLFNIDEYNLGMNRILKDESNSKYQEIEVISIDDFINSNSIDKINLIKIDVEGFEKEVLLGAINTINHFKPIIFIEINNEYLKEQNTSAFEIYHFLKSLNYSIFIAETNSPIKPDYNFDKCHFDAIATPN
jgi:FkbM family methyltransferase